MGVGLNENFLPPIQISVVDVCNWQKRGENNELERNQIQVSSLIVLTHTSSESKERIEQVKREVKKVNAFAKIVEEDSIAIENILNLDTNSASHIKLEHAKAHWSSCSVALPDPMSSSHLQRVLDGLPEGIIPIKGATRLDEDKGYSYIEDT